VNVGDNGRKREDVGDNGRKREDVREWQEKEKS